MSEDLIKGVCQAVAPLKRVLVLGNGFDLAVGRKTSYKDFYDSMYCPKFYPAPLIDFLNQKLGDKLDGVRWLDLETALQEYASLLIKQDCLMQDDIYVLKFYKIPYYRMSLPNNDKKYSSNIKKLLEKGYMMYVENAGFPYYEIPYREDVELSMMEREKKALELIERGLMNYLNAMSAVESNHFIIHTLKHYLENPVCSKVYSFNYTPVGNLLTDKAAQASEYDDSILYVHGSVIKGHVIVGAKDGNYEDYDFVQKSFDSQFNPPPLLMDMMEADEVVIFGHSLGDCDSQYFQPFFQRMISSFDHKKKKIVIYTYDENSEIDIKRNLNKLTDNHLSWLYSMTEFKIIKTKKEDETSE
ncbi:MAG: bacteriophage abortive infection AbiH family protein [Paludibacteraceae bacterium]|nr:bacteriophage abortive infection AbiH family protein [Paludibacteraceae bacterium]